MVEYHSDYKVTVNKQTYYMDRNFRQNLDTLKKLIKQDFDIEKIEYKFLNRETGLQDI